MSISKLPSQFIIDLLFSLNADCQMFTIMNNMNLVIIYVQCQANWLVTSAVDMSGTLYCLPILNLFVKTVFCYIACYILALLLSKSFPDSDRKIPGTFMGHNWMPDTKSIDWAKVYPTIFLNSLEKSSAIFTTIVRTELLKMCLKAQDLGTCACEIISRIARIVEVWLYRRLKSTFDISISTFSLEWQYNQYIKPYCMLFP